jgi:hypothetical protein
VGNIKRKEQKRMAKIKDKLWLWGQNPGVHHKTKIWNLPGTNRMTPMEGCEFFDIKNCCRVVMSNEPSPPFDKEADELRSLNKVIWSVVGDGGSDRTETMYGEIDEVIRIADLYPNVVGGILDDFFMPRRLENFKPEHVREIRRILHTKGKRELDLSVVLYTNTLECDIKAYLDECDVITMWTWEGSDLVNFDKNFNKVMSLSPDKRHMVGLYMWNYGECRPMTRAQMDIQFDRCFTLLKEKSIEGVIICSNCIADVGIEAVDWTRKWIDQIGDAEIEE